ncbi:UDP-N-acetylmuramoyl-L-alanyl-D-glutamate--2,6-diaminopimelate ligase [Clostridium cylindrosporum]|uniref:UDP-N-acetylmuramoyl-L-alanyl-D-glutamate--2,6-diaminopimelate ligase n=1 Tax=Clostridium cylindrosporum DSM 605 TaxID=1121307 RepID=A0A0J8D6C0_CLOCY|nr:UDP-N-acetylmuramoyl-L-alanyl-D-glutamate--2,6-diaminopimelate ligase [Clostridium cylindrosporum]KMT21402.1 UDP-N-acetylmuramoyl-L-alanyl-D-glutamate--2,6-diaminopimelate ligase MurE [Clostridium cylindrosporum DSM 605]
MKISDLVKNMEEVEVIGNDIDIKKLCYSTSDIDENSLFFCIVGLNVDGHTFIKKAIENGAKAIVVSKDLEPLNDVTVIKVKDTREAMSLISSNFYGNPSKEIDVIGITGTNGKTTSTFMMKSILEVANKKTSLLGTIYNIIGSKKEEAKRTTPESKDLQGLFRDMINFGDDSCIMEVSSHSLDLKRVYGVDFKVGIFTNLTQDHLDFHSDMGSYFNAKMKLFDNSEYAVINIDDEYGRKAVNKIKGKVLTYGLTNEANLFASDILISSEGAKFKLNYKGESEEILLHLPGKFNIYNALGCIGAALILNITLEDIKKGLESLSSVPGRSEKITSSKGFTVIIDYAHTPDGLTNILSTTKEYTDGNLIALFGCGGDRDRTKRPLMGKAAGEIADFCVVTSDNPRGEEPSDIIQDIIPGVKATGCNYTVIENRKDAIKYAIDNAKKGDVIVIAGKGHETYQILKNETIHFDEKEIVLDFLKEEL